MNHKALNKLNEYLTKFEEEELSIYNKVLNQVPKFIPPKIRVFNVEIDGDALLLDEPIYPTIQEVKLTQYVSRIALKEEHVYELIYNYKTFYIFMSNIFIQFTRQFSKGSLIDNYEGDYFTTLVLPDGTSKMYRTLANGDIEIQLYASLREREEDK